MHYKLDDWSRDLLGRVPPCLFIGVVADDRTVSLFYASFEIDPAARKFPGHESLVLAGMVRASRVRGFTFAVRDGRISRFYRNSILNQDLPASCISEQVMDAIIATLGLARADDFESYP
jgi:hypothetical protein